jgi:RarD protein
MGAKIKIIISMVVFGTIGLFVKNIPLPSSEIALFRAVIASVSIIMYQIVRGKWIKFNEIRNDLPLLFLSGAAMGFNWIFLFEAYNYTTVSIATLSYYFAPVIVMIACPFLFKEKLTVKQVVCFVMSTIGLILIIGIGDANTGTNTVKGICFGLGAAALYATVIIINKFIKKVAGIDRTLLQFFAAIIVLTPYVFATSGIHLSKAGNIGIINLLILGIIHTGIIYCLYFSSLIDLKGQEVAILSYIDPFVAIIISVAVLNEPITITQIAGGVLILGFTLFNELKIKHKQF